MLFEARKGATSEIAVRYELKKGSRLTLMLDISGICTWFVEKYRFYIARAPSDDLSVLWWLLVKIVVFAESPPV